MQFFHRLYRKFTWNDFGDSDENQAQPPLRHISWWYVRSVVSDSGPPWAVALQAPLSMEFSRQEYSSELPFPTPGDGPDPGIKLVSLASPALAGRFFTTVVAREATSDYSAFQNW